LPVTRIPAAASSPGRIASAQEIVPCRRSASASPATVPGTPTLLVADVVTKPFST